MEAATSLFEDVAVAVEENGSFSLYKFLGLFTKPCSRRRRAGRLRGGGHGTGLAVAVDENGTRSCQTVAQFRFRNPAGADGGQDDFVEAATALFKDVAVAVEENEAFLRSAFGTEALLGVISELHGQV